MTEMKPGWRLVKLGDVVDVITDYWDRDPSRPERFVAGEHIDEGSLRVSRWGMTNDDLVPPTFNRRFRVGDVLFHSRNLRKLAQPGFSGITGEKIFVLRTRDPRVLLQELLPFLLQAQPFSGYTERMWAGSTNKFLNKGPLVKYEFALPPLGEQILILQGLNACEKVTDALRGLLTTAIALLDSSAYELLCHSCIQSQGSAPPLYAPEDWEQMKISDMCERITYGFTNPMPTTQDGPWMVTAKDINNGVVDYNGARRTSVDAFQNLLTDKSRPVPGDVLLTKDGTLGRVGIVDRPGVCVNQSVAVLRPKKAVPSEFLAWTLRSSAMQARLMQDSGGSAIKHLYITKIGSVTLMAPKLRARMQEIASSLSDLEGIVASTQARLEAINALKKNVLSCLA